MGQCRTGAAVDMAKCPYPWPSSHVCYYLSESISQTSLTCPSEKSKHLFGEEKRHEVILLGARRPTAGSASPTRATICLRRRKRAELIVSAGKGEKKWGGGCLWNGRKIAKAAHRTPGPMRPGGASLKPGERRARLTYSPRRRQPEGERKLRLH